MASVSDVVNVQIGGVYDPPGDLGLIKDEDYISFDLWKSTCKRAVNSAIGEKLNELTAVKIAEHIKGELKEFLENLPQVTIVNRRLIRITC